MLARFEFALIKDDFITYFGNQFICQHIRVELLLALHNGVIFFNVFFS